MGKSRKVIDVNLWGNLIGKLAIDEVGIGYFRYSDEFISSGLELSPIWMPVKQGMVYSFPRLNKETFKGLPGMIADSLPDAFGDKLLDIHFEKEGIKNEADIELLKLCYISSKATGALEYAPPLAINHKASGELSINELLGSVEKLISSKLYLKEGDLNNIQDIISLGSSLGGAAPKAVIDIDFKNNLIRAGNEPNTPEYESWIIKFDAVKKGKELEYAQSTGFGNVEYAYSKMAKDCGVTMSECKLYSDEGRSHFMTRRFDRINGKKVHMQTLHAIGHMDSFSIHDYKTYFRVLSRLKLPHSQHEEMFRRIVFNGITGNTDTHTKNTSFLMNEQGKWSLSPCYDLICSVSMRNNIERHKTLINGKTHDFTLTDFQEVAKAAGIKSSKTKEIIDQVRDSVNRWPGFAKDNGVKEEHEKHVTKLITKNLRLTQSNSIKKDLRNNKGTG